MELKRIPNFHPNHIGYGLNIENVLIKSFKLPEITPEMQTVILMADGKMIACVEDEDILENFDFMDFRCSAEDLGPASDFKIIISPEPGFDKNLFGEVLEAELDLVYTDNRAKIAEGTFWAKTKRRKLKIF